MTGRRGSGRTVVIGVGNDFRRDDGVAWRVVGRLRERAEGSPLPPGTELRECDGDPGRLIGLWEGAELAVVVDAAHAHPPSPGRVHRLELDRRRLWRDGAASSHGLGLGEAVELSRALGTLPARLVVYAVEGADSTLGTGLSAPVAAAVEPLTARIEADIGSGDGTGCDGDGPPGIPAGPARPAERPGSADGPGPDRPPGPGPDGSAAAGGDPAAAGGTHAAGGTPAVGTVPGPAAAGADAGAAGDDGRAGDDGGG
ncbi:hydrogenase maturation protease [Streptomyces xinghaiensis]|uniref:hydrogenase maturation protease n=1 Tax=Streptomyces xinghaiensis TaxID=1038928 RepID=UPI0039908C89